MSTFGPAKHWRVTPQTREAVKALHKCANARITRTGCTGITTWIRNTARAGVPFSASRANNARGTEGLSIGRVADAMLRKYCNNETIPRGYGRNYFDNAARALAREKLMPVAAQIPCALGALRTEIDAICLREGASGRVGLVVVEFKTSRQTLAQHTESYEKPCLRKPRMDVAGLKNSERTAHQLQADFGLKALRKTYPHLAAFYMESVVLYATATGAKIYPVTPFEKTIFETAGPPAVHCGTKENPNVFPILPTAPAGGTIIRNILKRAGHKDIVAGGGASCTSIDAAGTPCVIGISPGWYRLSEAKRRGLKKKLKTASRTKVPWLVCRNKDRDWVAAPIGDV